MIDGFDKFTIESRQELTIIFLKHFCISEIFHNKMLEGKVSLNFYCKTYISVFRQPHLLLSHWCTLNSANLCGDSSLSLLVTEHQKHRILGSMASNLPVLMTWRLKFG